LSRLKWEAQTFEQHFHVEVWVLDRFGDEAIDLQRDTGQTFGDDAGEIFSSVVIRIEVEVANDCLAVSGWKEARINGAEEWQRMLD
jgi:hypothetical protein